ncbi:MAG: hypothetical protein KGI67_14535, partial [Pseudomonadota bacterium]|nr:hypothetical protein [Pseudomonadota bacterium]
MDTLCQRGPISPLRLPFTPRRALCVLPRVLLMAPLLLAAAGCTVTQLRQQELQDQARVDDKQAALAREEAHAQDLAQQRQALDSDLASRQLSLDELTARLALLRAANQHQETDNVRLRQQRETLLGERRQLLDQAHASNVQLAALQAAGG